MSDKLPITPTYIKTPQAKGGPQKISIVLETRIREFMLSRRRARWQREGR